MQSASCLSLKWDITVFELRSGTLVICELLATIQPVREMQAAGKESYQSALYQVYIFSLHYFKSAC